MKFNEICDRLTAILQYESKEITYGVKDEDIVADLDCYAITGTTAAQINDFSREVGKPCVITIKSVADPKIQIVL